MQFNCSVLLTFMVIATLTSVLTGKKRRSHGWDNDLSDQTGEVSRKHVMVNCGSGSQALTAAMIQKLTALTEKVTAQSGNVKLLSEKFKSLKEKLNFQSKIMSQKFAILSKHRPGKRGPQGHQGPVGPKGSPGTGGGTTYIRYGRTTCPRTSNLVYSGMVAGSAHSVKGGGTEYLCLRNKFQWNKYTDAKDGHSAYLYGSEYQSITTKFFSTKHSRSFHDYNVPCALCHTPARGARIMIAGGRTCEKGWTREYEGYLLTSHDAHNSKQYACVDEAPEVIPGTKANKNGALMYKVVAACPGQELPCKTGYREVTCVVCTK